MLSPGKWLASTCAAFDQDPVLQLTWTPTRRIRCYQVEEIRDACEIRHFYQNKLGISDRSVSTTTWPEVLQRIVLLQQHIRLCVVRDLTAHDICARVMRKDNMLIGMLNKVGKADVKALLS
jgi:hypothetical protein